MRTIIAVFTMVFALSMVPLSFAQNTSDDVFALEKSTIKMSIPSNNKLPWGFVEGTVTSPAEGYPVIIQIYKGDEPVHFAQVPVNPDGSYQYRFRTLDTTDGKTTRIFDGDYTVKIFKAVNLNLDYLDSYLKDTPSSLVSILF